ncbi:co-chaperone protein HscB-like [Hylaeus volcanicus]|uniref:co-chaperone protein HscB-like n=1 Tax=Hylaeus volcanicus TaxID=313075 RepID=UPI0023B7DD67|nr:co-chaperone protein HscB-like [Hylaeus volcanicus]
MSLKRTLQKVQPKTSAWTSFFKSYSYTKLPFYARFGVSFKPARYIPFENQNGCMQLALHAVQPSYTNSSLFVKKFNWKCSQCNYFNESTLENFYPPSVRNVTFCQKCDALSTFESFLSNLKKAKNIALLFNVPFKYNICLKTVKRHYRQLQSCIHPDRYASTPEEAYAANLSALISSCYSIITDSLRWASVMLEHYSQEGLVKSSHDARLNGTLLHEVFEIEERIEKLVNQHETELLYRNVSNRLLKEKEQLCHVFESHFFEDAVRLLDRCQMFQQLEHKLLYLLSSYKS